MSVRVMTAVWNLALPDSEKIVLLALADCANDEGGCWPSMATLARKCSKSDRTVQAAIKALVESGHLTRTEVLGRGCSYIVHPRSDFTPEAASPPKGTTPTPEAASDKPSITVIEDEWVARERAILTSPEWKAFKAMRREIKRPVNETSQKSLMRELRKLAEAGYPPGAVLEQSTINCWRGVFQIKEPDNGYSAANRGGNGRMGGPRPDPTLALVRAAVAAQRPDDRDHRDAGPSLSPRQLGGP